MLKPGLYEQVINKAISKELESVPDGCKDIEKIDTAEAPKVLSAYVSEIIKQKLDAIFDEKGSDSLEQQVNIANQVIQALKLVDGDDEDVVGVENPGTQLLALMDSADPRLTLGRKAKDLERPETSLAFSSLFTGAIREPQMLGELKKEIASAYQIDMLVSFIKWSGLRQLIDELREFTGNGGQLRVICTSYMGATDAKAVEELSKLPNTTVKISYDTKRTRLHAKAYVFYRETDFVTAYIGSSNMSNAALTSGLEWNVKATKKDMASTIEKVEATFESYWNDSEFEEFDQDQIPRLEQALRDEKYVGDGDNRRFVFDITPYSYQQEILDKLEAERSVLGYYKNLVVAATGCGKTVISAFDYRGYCEKHPKEKNRLLFVAHREEILEQSIETFRGVLKDLNFGQLYVGSHQPSNLDYLFVSIQTLNSKKLYELLAKDYYSFIVVDEFHHAAAPIYQNLLSHFTPDILLGLTATPERMDGENILKYFNNRIAAEIRLPEAIDRKLLCPFQYFGITDTIDLSEVKWTRGGYDKQELSNILSMNEAVAKKRAGYVIDNINKYVTSVNDMKALGFCVSVEHAKYMASIFNKCGIAATEIDGNTKEDERAGVKKRLEDGEIKIIFVVDLYNEGIDITSINTVLFLRPTESLTIFLQQLGRGLRLDNSKDCLTVLDFIGQANKKYNYEEKFSALLSNTKHSVEEELKKGFVSIPKGCYIMLEKQASKYVLDNIRNSIETKNGLISKIQAFEEDTGKELSLKNFLEYYHLNPHVIYQRANFARLCVDAEVITNFEEPLEETIDKALPRLAGIDSRRWLKFLLKILPKMDKLSLDLLNEEEKRMLQMFYVTVWQKTIDYANPDEAVANLRGLTECRHLVDEMVSLLQYNYDHIDFVDQKLDFGFDCPIDSHCTYSRDQLLVAMDFMKPSTVREGVKWLPDKKIDVLFITLNKSDKDYSPTTMYKDYSINNILFHWQSQSTTSDSSTTGRRYINHVTNGSKVLLCVRDAKRGRWNDTSPYTVLGFANYVKHTGSKPMNITWKLEQEIPAKYIKETKKLIVG